MEMKSRSTVVSLLGRHRPDDCKLLQFLGDTGQVFRNPYSGYGGFDGLEWSPVGMIGFGIERIGLSRPATHPQNNTRPLSVRVIGRGCRQRGQPARAGNGASRGTEELTAVEGRHQTLL